MACACVSVLLAAVEPHIEQLRDRTQRVLALAVGCHDVHGRCDVRWPPGTAVGS